MTISFGAFLPDQPTFENPGATVATNVLPRTGSPQGGATTYGPLSSLASISDALTNRPQGAGAFRDDVGAVYTFAGDINDIFSLTTTAWNNVSKSTNAYSTATDDAWNFIQYGTRVIGVNGHTDAPQSYVMGSSSAFADLGGSPPKARHVAVVKDFVVLGNILGATNRVHWDAIDDPTDWPTIGSADAAAKQSDRQDLPIGGAVMAMTGAVGGLDGVILCEKAIFNMQYDGPPHIFSVREVVRDRGVFASNSVVNIGTQVFFLSEDGFMAFNGSGVQAIGDQKIDKTFFNDLDATTLHRVYSAADPINHLIFWAYAGSGNTSGRPNKVLIYNWATDRWSSGGLEMDFLFRDLTKGYTLDELDAFGNLDTLQASLDSRIWTGGNLVLSAFDSDHKLARFTGSSLGATLETGEINGGTLFNKPHERIFVNGIRPYIDTPDANMKITLRHRDTLGSTLSDTSSNAIDANGMANFTQSARFHRARVSISASSSWTHAVGLDFDADEDGEI